MKHFYFILALHLSFGSVAQELKEIKKYPLVPYIQANASTYFYRHDNLMSHVLIQESIKGGVGFGAKKKYRISSNYFWQIANELQIQEGFRAIDINSTLPNWDIVFYGTQKWLFYNIPFSIMRETSKNRHFAIKLSTNIFIKPLSYLTDFDPFPYSNAHNFNWVFFTAGIEYYFKRFPIQLFAEHNFTNLTRNATIYMPSLGFKIELK
jgi:hypothetical protein